MTTITNLILNSICLFFPISIYVNYLSYLEKQGEDEKKLILDLVLVTSLYLIILYDKNPTIYSITLCHIPLLLSLLKKEKKLFLILFAILLFHIVKTNIFSPILFIIKCISYILIFYYLKLTSKKKLIYFTFIELVFLMLIQKQLTIVNLINSLSMILIELLIIIIMSKILNKKQNNLELDDVIKELEREKLLRSSISKLTHELKNPIAVCKGYLEMMDLQDSKKTKKYLSIITEEIDRSKTIMDEFSDYGKLKKLELEEMDISILLEDISHILLPIFIENEAILDIQEINELYIKGDYYKLKQVLINLLKNTLEAKKENRKLIVKIKIRENKQSITITVKDNGIGMTEDVLSKVSEVFYTTKRQGTGLGLAFSKEVVELHKGIMRIKSQKDKGTEIIIRLPKEKKSEDFNNKNY